MSASGNPGSESLGSGYMQQGPRFLRQTWAEVDYSALRRNAETMLGMIAPSALCAVVKANGYGHGSVTAAKAFLDGGATCLAVATAEEALEIRAAGIEAPVLLLSEPDEDALEVVVVNRITPTVYSEETVKALEAMADRLGQKEVRIHLKVDTGMRRVGAYPQEALRLAEEIAASRNLILEGVWTHFPTADEADNGFTVGQMKVLSDFVEVLAARRARPEIVHAANSAGAIRFPGSRFTMARCGISLYGYLPGAVKADELGEGILTPALSLKSRVSMVKVVAPGEGVSYGHRYRTTEETVIATVPIGYADGVRRSLGTQGASVLIGGRRCPIAGTVTMDQLLVEVPAGLVVKKGDEVVLIGEQEGQSITADDWASRQGTISYEILCAIGTRVPRLVVNAP